MRYAVKNKGNLVRAYELGAGSEMEKLLIEEGSICMQADGSYLREPDGAGTSSQERLYQYFSRRRVSLKSEDSEPESGTTEGPKTTAAADAGISVPETVKKTESVWERFKKLFI